MRIKRKALLGLVGLAMAAITFAKLPEIKTIVLGETEYVDIDKFLQKSPLSFEEGDEENGQFQLASDDHDFVFRVGSREVIVDGARYWLSFPPKEKAETFYLSRIDLETLVQPIVQPGEIKLPDVETIVLDPGHGGHDSGAEGELGVEKNYTLDIVERIGKVLEKRGLNVKTTRSEDVFIPLGERPVIADPDENSLFVSIHLNSGPPTPTARGFEVFAMTPRGAPSTSDVFKRMEVLRSWPGNKNARRSFLLAETVHRNVLSELGLFDRGVKRARFIVLKNAEVPGILIEGGFLSNEEDAIRIDDPEWRQKLADSIAGGIVNYVRSANDGFEMARNTEEILENQTGFITQ